MQLMQIVEPTEVENVPAGQAVQGVVSALKNPAGQATQVVDAVAPSVDEAVPAAQPIQPMPPTWEL